MKSKFLKVILPAFAIMLAIGLSSFTANDTSQIGYYDDPFEGPKQVPGLVDCGVEVSQDPCLHQGLQVYGQINPLAIPLTKNP